MSDQWFFAQNGQQRGPVSLDALKQMCATGQVRPSDLVWSEGMPTWQPAGKISGLIAPGSIPPPLPGVANASAVGYATPAGYGVAPPRLGDDAGTRWLLPVGRSPWAIVAGYMGLFSVLLLPAPLALVFGVIAIRDIRRHPERRGMGRAVFGIVMGLICTVLLGIVLIGNLR